jgi:cohesin complex subunit SCC1
VTELNDAANRRGAQSSFSKADVSAITTHYGYLSDSVVVMRLMEIRADPLAHFFPTKATEAGSFYCVAPPGLAPEISNLYLFPAAQGAGQKRKGPAQNDRAAKRQRLESEPVDDVEQARERVGSRAPSIRPFEGDGGGFDGFGDESGFIPNNDDSMPMGEFQFAVDDSLHIDQPAASSPIAPAGLVDDDCAVAMFDTQPMTQDDSMVSRSQQSPQKEKDEAVNKDGYSRNTVKAIGLLRQELNEAGKGADGLLSFSGLTEGVRGSLIFSWLKLTLHHSYRVVAVLLLLSSSSCSCSEHGIA